MPPDLKQQNRTSQALEFQSQRYADRAGTDDANVLLSVRQIVESGRYHEWGFDNSGMTRRTARAKPTRPATNETVVAMAAPVKPSQGISTAQSRQHSISCQRSAAKNGAVAGHCQHHIFRRQSYVHDLPDHKHNQRS